MIHDLPPEQKGSCTRCLLSPLGPHAFDSQSLPEREHLTWQRAHFFYLTHPARTWIVSRFWKRPFWASNMPHGPCRHSFFLRQKTSSQSFSNVQSCACARNPSKRFPIRLDHFRVAVRANFNTGTRNL